MSPPTSPDLKARHQSVRDWVAFNLGLGAHREQQVYLAVWRIGRRVATSYGRALDPTTLDDCIHDAMLRIRTHRDILEMQYPAAYFSRAVDNACKSALRARSRDRLQTQFEAEDGSSWESALPAGDPTMEALLGHEQCWALVMARLSPEQHDSLALALEIRLDGLSADEVAERLGRTQRAITQAVSHFVNVTLRRVLEEVCPGLVQEVTGRLG